MQNMKTKESINHSIDYFFAAMRLVSHVLRNVWACNDCACMISNFVASVRLKQPHHHS